MGKYQQLQWACEEASRCLFCEDAPCIRGCPAHINIPQFIRLIRWNDMKGAKKVIKDDNCLGGLCAYLCPSEELCQEHCVCNKTKLPIHIAALQKYACDNAGYTFKTISDDLRNKKIAIIGAGPAGISCAVELKKRGSEVVIYEKEKCITGTIAREIPEFKIPEKIIEKEVNEFNNFGIKINFGIKVENSYLHNEILEKYDAVFLSTGLNKDREHDLNPKNLGNVYQASSFLSSVKKSLIEKIDGVCITIGGGDTAIDCARTALKMGASRSIIAYRRSKEEMPGCEVEFIKAVKEGVEFLFLTSPTSLKGKDKVSEVELIRNELVPSKPGERKSFIQLSGTEFRFPADFVVFALSKERDECFVDILSKNDFTIDPNTLQVGKSKCFVGGDLVNGGKTVVEAVADGKKAAISIEKYLKKF